MNLPKYDRYVYMLFAGDAPQPFYVGIGKHGTRRHEHHERYAGKEKANPAKNQFLRECKAAGIKIRYIVPETCLTVDEACRGEIELISIWGRRELGTGPLFNMNAGGVGGHDPAPSTRAKMSAWQRGKKHSPGHVAKVASANLGRKLSPEHCAKISAANRGRKRSPEFCAKANRGKKHSPEHVAKRAAAHRGKKRPPEFCARNGVVHRGKKLSPEHRAKLAAALHGRKRSPEAVEKTAAWHRGKNLSPEICTKISAALRRRHATRARSPDQGEFKF